MLDTFGYLLAMLSAPAHIWKLHISLKENKPKLYAPNSTKFEAIHAIKQVQQKFLKTTYSPNNTSKYGIEDR